MLKIIAVLIVSVLSSFGIFAEDTPDQLRDKGFDALKAAQSDDTKIVEAARLLAQSAEAYEKAGNDSAASELGSYLFWCKKRMTLEQAEAFAGKGDTGKRIAERLNAVVAQKVEASDATKWLERADAFAAAHPKEPLLCAIRYFEVADRFIGAQESLIAQRKSLDLMGKASGPAPQAMKEFAAGDLTVKFNWPTVCGAVEARTGVRWFMIRDGAKFPVDKLPRELNGSRLIQQNDHKWIGGFDCNKPVTVYVALRTSVANAVALTDQDIKGLSGWSVVSSEFTTSGLNGSTGDKWKWKVITRRVGPGSVQLENPFPSKDIAAILFIK